MSGVRIPPTQFSPNANKGGVCMTNSQSLDVRPVFYTILSIFVFALIVLFLSLIGTKINLPTLLAAAAFTAGFMLFVTGITMVTVHKSGPKAACSGAHRPPSSITGRETPRQ